MMTEPTEWKQIPCYVPRTVLFERINGSGRIQREQIPLSLVQAIQKMNNVEWMGTRVHAKE